MNEEKMIAATAIVTATLTEAGKKLVGPITGEIGLAFGDLAGVYRFYQNDCLSRIFTKWAEARKDKPPLTDEDVRKVLPLLTLASVQSDDELQSRWAALMENTVSSSPTILPSFGQTLSQLTGQEARALDRLYHFVMQPADCVTEYNPGYMPVGRDQLIIICDPTIGAAPNAAERQVFKDRLTNEQREQCERIDRVELVIQDIKRLGIIEQESYTEDPGGYYGAFSQDSFKEPQFRFTPYGLSFVRTVSPTKGGFNA